MFTTTASHKTRHVFLPGNGGVDVGGGAQSPGASQFGGPPLGVARCSAPVG